jgi:hypothetical protein
MLDNMPMILSPNTVYKHRRALIGSVQRVYGDLTQPSDSEQLGSGQPALRRAMSHVAEVSLDLREKESIRKNLNTCVISLMRQWMARCKRLILVRSQVGGIMEKHCQPYCQYCGADWGLQCESIDNVEDVFVAFVHSTYRRAQYDSWKANEWQNYFERRVTFRTLCGKCYESIKPNGGEAHYTL